MRGRVLRYDYDSKAFCTVSLSMTKSGPDDVMYGDVNQASIVEAADNRFG